MNKEIAIRTEIIELDAFLKFAGLCMTGGEAKIRIHSGEISVNGDVCTQRKKKLRPGDRVTVQKDTYTVVGKS